MNELRATITPSPARRWLTVVLIFVLGGLLFYIGIDTFAAAPVAGFLLLLSGGVILYGGTRFHAGTRRHIALEDGEIRDSEGVLLASLDNIKSVDRGAFANKPSSGLKIVLHKPGRFIWVPGLWWRVGRTIGIGGSTPPHEAKLMAELLNLELMERGADGAPD